MSIDAIKASKLMDVSFRAVYSDEYGKDMVTVRCSSCQEIYTDFVDVIKAKIVLDVGFLCIRCDDGSNRVAIKGLTLLGAITATS